MVLLLFISLLWKGWSGEEREMLKREEYVEDQMKMEYK